MNHTPGKWVVGGPYPAITVCYIADIEEGRERWELITRLWDYKDGEAPEEVKANARLIAAAPELIEALDGLLHAITYYFDVDDLPCGVIDAEDAARAAIAKARGEE